MIHRIAITLTTLMISLLIVSTSHAQTLYRWVDENGKVHFSDTPPVNQSAEEITPDAPAAVIDNSNSPFSPEAIAKRKAQREAEKAKQPHLSEEEKAYKTELAALKWRAKHCQQLGGPKRNANGGLRHEPLRWECTKKIPKAYRKYLK